MTAVGVMEMSLDQVVRMPAVRHRLVATARAVGMGLLVLPTGMTWGAVVRVRRADGNLVIIHMIAMHMMQMPVVQIIRVPIVFDSDVTASGFVIVAVISMGLTGGAHSCPSQALREMQIPSCSISVSIICQLCERVN